MSRERGFLVLPRLWGRFEEFIQQRVKSGRLIDNRPYLRCLHGYGLYLWWSVDLAAAAGDEVNR